MAAESAITYLLFYFALSLGAIPLANFVYHFVTAFCQASHATATGGSIRLATGDEDQPKKPFPRWAMYAVAALSLVGFVFQLVIFGVGLSSHHYRWMSLQFTWFWTEITFTVIWLILFIYAIIYPRVWTFALTGSIPPSRPRLTWEKSISYTNPGKLLQVSGIILLLLPFVASLEQYSWYNDMYWHGGVIYGGLGVLCVSQPTFGAILLVWGTVWRIKFGDGKPDGDEPTYVDIERGRVSRLVGAKSIAEEGQ